jgi:hypothetical protein
LALLSSTNPLGVVPPGTNIKPWGASPLSKTSSDWEGVPGVLDEEYERQGKGKRNIKGTRRLAVFSSD